MSAPPAHPLNPLSNPKGVELRCEICAKNAYLQCTACNVTRYCNIEHQKLDWIAIHQYICSDLAIVRKPLPFSPSEEERRKQRGRLGKQKKELVEFTNIVGQKLLFEDKYEEAVPAALQCLRFTEELNGCSSVELVPPYLILAEACIGLSRLDQAESYLAQAQWTTFKAKHECTNAIMSKLNRRLAQLFRAKKDFDSALECLAQDIYYSSLEYGPSSIETAGGYFEMAMVYQKLHGATQNNEYEGDNIWAMKQPSAAQKLSRLEQRCEALVMNDNNNKEQRDPTNSMPLGIEIQAELKELGKIQKPNSYGGALGVVPRPTDLIKTADDLFSRVVDIWSMKLAELLKEEVSVPEVPRGVGSVVAEITKTEVRRLNAAQKAEAVKIFTVIQNHYRVRKVDDDVVHLAPASGLPDALVLFNLTYSMLKYTIGDQEKAEAYLSDAKFNYERADPHKRVDDYLSLLDQCLAKSNAKVKVCVK